MANGKDRTGLLVEFDNDIWDELAEVAEKESRTKKAVIQRALRNYFDSLKTEARAAKQANKSASVAA